MTKWVKHGKSEILYTAPVEPCRGNGRRAQGDGITSELLKKYHLFARIFDKIIFC